MVFSQQIIAHRFGDVMVDGDADVDEYEAFIASVALLRKYKLDRNAEAELLRFRAERAAFNLVLRQTWEPALDAYFRALRHVRDFGHELNSELFAELADQEPHLVHVMTQLHAKACLVALEIWALLDAGLSQGALARWRTLHEI